MRNEQEIRDKIRELEASHQNFDWTPKLLGREIKMEARAKIWGMLYSLGYGEEDVVNITGGTIPDDLYLVIHDTTRKSPLNSLYDKLTGRDQ